MNNEYIKHEIREYYKRENTIKLAKRLGLTVTNLRKKASRLGIKKEAKTNKIMVGESKLCSRCKKILPVSEFRKDKYQLNGLDYNCKSCRKLALTHKTVLKTVLKPKNNSQNSIKFNKSKKHNPVITVNGIESLKCKACENIKPLNQFHKDKNNLSGHKNFCKSCIAEKRKKSN